MKICKKCEQEKDESEFYHIKNGYFSNTCKECKSLYMKLKYPVGFYKTRAVEAMSEVLVWKDIPDYEGFYKISNIGTVYSLKSGIHVKSQFKKRHGYVNIQLTKNGIETTHRLHRLVAKTFIPNPENKPQVNHINGIKTDNYVENLEWMTCRENISHAIKTGLRTKDSYGNTKMFGKNNPKSKSVKIWNEVEEKHFSSIAEAIKYGTNYLLYTSSLIGAFLFMNYDNYKRKQGNS